MRPHFSAEPSRPGFVVVDPVQRRRFPVTTDAPVDPEPADPDAFRQPVSAAATVTAGELRLPYVVGVFVWRDGEMVAEVHHDEEQQFGDGEYVLELSPVVKLYLRAGGPLDVRSVGEETVVAFDAPTRVVVGARSYHERPAGTITVTEDPRDVMTALSHFGSALKTTSPERSFPTLRGHPPLVEFGEEFSVPDGIEPPETGVTVEVPPEPEYVLPVASLAYYLGATVEPGPEPRLRTDAGLDYGLSGGGNGAGSDGGGGGSAGGGGRSDSGSAGSGGGGTESGGDAAAAYQDAVARTLRQVFALDCVTRTDGLYPIDLHERRVLEERLDLDFPALYEASLEERLAAYLEVPYEDVADQAPTWCLSAHCLPELEHAEYLPFVVDDLGIVETVTLEETHRDPEFYEQIDEFTRSVERSRAEAVTRGASTKRGKDDIVDVLRRGPNDFTDDVDDLYEDVDYIAVPDSDALEQVWIGDRWPLNAGKFLMAGFENRLAETEEVEASSEVENVTITVVCNEEEMREEFDETLYGDREELPFEIRSHFDVTTSELREILGRRTDFLHYIGHIEDSEFVCSDGHLDIESVDSVGARAFLLNGCKSMHQGPRMLEAGSVAGIVTLSDVGNRGAIRIGKLVARLLNHGFSVGSAVVVVRDHSLMANQYVAVGDTRTAIVQSESHWPTVLEIGKLGTDSYDLKITNFPSRRSFGGGYIPYLEEVDEFFIGAGRVPTFEDLSKRVLEKLLRKGNPPIVYDSELMWADSFSWD